MKKYLCYLCACLGLFLSTPFWAQHTFSIVAVDLSTGEVGSAGATCGDDVIWPGTGGAILISDILPGIGAIHTQSYYLEENQIAARTQMEAGQSPEQIIDYLVSNDVVSNPTLRQYGIVDMHNGQARSAGYTGVNCLNYKNHLLGETYAIQGNILLGAGILDSMEARFLNTEGPLAVRLMAALQGANVAGADSRCLDEGVSSLSAFVRVARPDDVAGNFYLDLNVPSTAFGVEPIDSLQVLFDEWLVATDVDNPTQMGRKLQVYPNPAKGAVQVTLADLPGPQTELKLVDTQGRLLLARMATEQQTEIDVSGIATGVYLILMEEKGRPVASTRLIIH